MSVVSDEMRAGFAIKERLPEEWLDLVTAVQNASFECGGNNARGAASEEPYSVAFERACEAEKALCGAILKLLEGGKSE